MILVLDCFCINTTSHTPRFVVIRAAKLGRTANGTKRSVLLFGAWQVIGNAKCDYCLRASSNYKSVHD